MAQNSGNKNTLKNIPFYNEEIESVKKKKKKKISLKFLLKNLNNYLINSYHSHQEEKKDLKD